MTEQAYVRKRREIADEAAKWRYQFIKRFGRLPDLADALIEGKRSTQTELNVLRRQVVELKRQLAGKREKKR